WNHDCLIFDTNFKDHTQQDIVRYIRDREAQASFNKNKKSPLVLIAAIDPEMDPHDSLAAGMNASSLNHSEEHRGGSDQINEFSRFARNCNAVGQGKDDRPIISAGSSKMLTKLEEEPPSQNVKIIQGVIKDVKIIQGVIKVLVVDDDNGQRMVMRAMLSKMGYFEVVTAEDGEQALGRSTRRDCAAPHALAKIQETSLLLGRDLDMCETRAPSRGTSREEPRDASSREEARGASSRAASGPSRKSFDLVLMDGFMPNMTGSARRPKPDAQKIPGSRKPGAEKPTADIIILKPIMHAPPRWDCTRAVRTAEDAAGITDRLIIIGVTGATNASDERKCIDAGMTDVTYKPMTRDALVFILQSSAAESVAASPLVTLQAVAREGPLRVLVVDDGAGSRITVKALLSRENHTVEIAKNGEEALKKVSMALFDVAIINAAESSAGTRPMYIIGATSSSDQNLNLEP
ncbi:hypothetical protein T484DRAFT_1786520, partial [Baffinella frigidus]